MWWYNRLVMYPIPITNLLNPPLKRKWNYQHLNNSGYHFADVPELGYSASNG